MNTFTFRWKLEENFLLKAFLCAQISLYYSSVYSSSLYIILVHSFSLGLGFSKKLKSMGTGIQHYTCGFFKNPNLKNGQINICIHIKTTNSDFNL